MKSRPPEATFIVTGANAGIGFEIARGLAERQQNVILACRDETRGGVALERIRQEFPETKATLCLVDLASLDSIREFARNVEDQENLAGLINNAAIIPKKRSLSEDGLELQFAVNHLATFALSLRLLPTLRRRRSNSPAHSPARIINVASHAHFRGRLDFDDLQSEKSYHPRKVYSATKLANLLFTLELDRRLRSAGIDSVTVNALHPGVIATSLLASYLGPLGSILGRLVGKTPERGARTPLYLALAEDVAHRSGEYFAQSAVHPRSKKARDPATTRKLWEISESMSGLSWSEILAQS